MRLLYYRLRGRLELRKLSRDQRKCCKTLAAETLRNCDSLDGVDHYVRRHATMLHSAGRIKTQFGIAEILIIIQVIYWLWKLADAMGWLKSATPAKISEELGE